MKKENLNLVIVESPTKARTISKFLGNKYKIESSFGHIRDLPKSKLGVDTENNFQPQYVIPTKKRKHVNVLKKMAAKAEKVILATDEDREGEAIAWHLLQALGLQDRSKSTNESESTNTPNTPRIERIVFHEITESAIKEALEHPRDIDNHLVDAQQARRVLDRLVGYLLSPFLWKKLFRGLSAGRVQSVALRLIVEREEEIRNFKPEGYWLIDVSLRPDNDDKKDFTVSLARIGDKNLDKLDIKEKSEVEKIVKDLESARYFISDISRKQTKRNPLPPFTTSTLQQEANKRLRFSARQTMRFAQTLYEHGHITYMRTDSVNLSSESLAGAKKWLNDNLGAGYSLETPRFFKNKTRLAQEAHEAIRPTRPSFSPKTLGGDAGFETKQEEKLYDLIWRRFMASQMPEAVFDATVINVNATKEENEYGLRANGISLKYDGFLKIWPSKFIEKELPIVQEDSGLECLEVQPSEHFTEPPPRFNEASLIKILEEYGIGRPSTYAPIISVIQGRNYVEKNESRRFQPTETGEAVSKLLTDNFPEVVDAGFTAQMEEKLDKIAEGDGVWNEIVETFYRPFKAHLDAKYEEVGKISFQKFEEKTDEVCEKCGKPMVIKMGRFGKFMACSGFPECKNTKKIISEKESFGACSKCNEGTVIRKRTKTKRFFYGCSRYPDCDYASWTKPETKPLAT